jgi:hypothetical protein
MPEMHRGFEDTRQERGLSRQGLRTRFVAVACLAAVSLIANASPAAGSVNLGQVPSDPPTSTCGVEFDYAQPTVTSGTSYVVPGTGTITSWTHNAISGSGQSAALKVFRKVAEPATYVAVGHEGPHDLAPGTLNGFPASIPVKPGDVLGLYITGSALVGCIFVAPGDSYLNRSGNLADGEFGSFNTFSDGYRVNVSAVFVYSNAFTFGKIDRNMRKGTATVSVDVPNPGEVTASGKGVKAASARAEISKSVGAGPAQLLIKANGKKKTRLDEFGKVKLRVAVAYTPTGGDPSTQSTKVKLRKKL